MCCCHSFTFSIIFLLKLTQQKELDFCNDKASMTGFIVLLLLLCCRDCHIALCLSILINIITYFILILN